jgi:heptosyltransferase-2
VSVSGVQQQLLSAKRILVIRYRFIGDTVLATPFLYQLRQACPNAQIDVLVAPNSGELLAIHPDINHLLFFHSGTPHRYDMPHATDCPGFWQTVSTLRQRQYDVALILKRSWTAALLPLLAGIPVRIGWSSEGRGLLLTHRVAYDPHRHEVDCFLDVLRAAGLTVPTDPKALPLWAGWPDRAQAEATQLLAPAKAAFANAQHWAVHITSAYAEKRWPDAHWLALAQWLISQNVVLHTFGPMLDFDPVETIREQLPHDLQSRWVNHCGQGNLHTSWASIHQLDAMIGADSGPLHLAAACDKPVVALFGPMSPNKWHPWGTEYQVVKTNLPCQPCNLKAPCRFNLQCMQDLSVVQVQSACQALLAPALPLSS